MNPPHASTADPTTFDAPPRADVRAGPPTDPDLDFRDLTMLQLLAAALASIGIWWASTAVLIFFNFIPGAQIWVFLTSLTLAISGGTWLLRNGDRTGTRAAYISFTAGLLVWGFAESSFYTGFIFGLDLPPIQVDGPGVDSFFHVIGLSLWHELLALGLGILAAWKVKTARNPFGWYVFLMLFLFHQSAKLNVFLGVQNTGKEFIPDTVATLRPHMTEASMNPLFPISIMVITVIAWTMLRKSLDTSIPRWRRIGFVLIGTMAALALLEHWFLMIPLQGGGVGLPGHTH